MALQNSLRTTSRLVPVTSALTLTIIRTNVQQYLTRDIQCASQGNGSLLCPVTGNVSRQYSRATPTHTMHLGRVSAYKQHGSATAPPQTPLCERPAEFVESLGQVLDWKALQSERISAIGGRFEQEDGGPGKDELLRELDWVLDDAVQAYRINLSSAWEVSSWRQLEPDVRAAVYRGAADPRAWQVQMRAPVVQLHAWWDRRLQGREPFQYLISTAHWHSYVLSVGLGVLVPRPETEIFPELVDLALAHRPELASGTWADLGTGSGAIAISTAHVLLKHNKDVSVVAVDLSPAALAHAAFNAARCGVAGHVQVKQGSWFEPLETLGLRGSLAGLLSNPPYIPAVQMQGLQAEVSVHEPWSALSGGDEAGMESLQVLCTGAVDYLRPGGFLAFETAGPPQVHQVAELLRSMPANITGASASRFFEAVQVMADCYGVERFVTASRSL